MKRKNFLQAILLRLTSRRRHDREASEIAARHGMLEDYMAARRNGLSPLEALEEFDLVGPEERQLFS